MKHFARPVKAALIALVCTASLTDRSVGQIAVETTKLLASDGAAEDLFGVSVAISGNTAIVGAYLDDDNGDWSGSGYVFDTITGDQLFKLLPDDGTANDWFGFSVAISGNTAIVGAYEDDDNGFNTGSAYLFDTVTGQQIAKLLPDDGAFGDFFGSSVAISDTIAIVGALHDDDNGANSGSAYLFDTTTGLQIAKILPNDGAVNDLFGVSVAISGATFIVGAYGDDDNGNFSGSAYLFDTTTGDQLFKLLPSDGAEEDFFGFSVAISGTIAIVGAWADDDNGFNTGSAYLFDTTTGQQIAKLLPKKDGQGSNYFGRSVAISGAIAIVGESRNEDNGLESGSAYLFDTSTGQQIGNPLLPSDNAAGDYFGFSVAISDSTAVIGAPGDDDNGDISGSAYVFLVLGEPGEDDPPQQPTNEFGLLPDKRFLVFVTHGWQVLEEDDCLFFPPSEITHEYLEMYLVPEINKDIGNDAALDPNEWQVIAHDWTDRAATGCSIGAANQALNHAMEIGQDLAEVVSAMNYEYVHFIAHSAGTGMIAEAVRNIDSPGTQIMCTFLDPFLGFPLPLLPFGEGSTWSDEYFAADITSIYTDVPPKLLHRVNVTWLDEKHLFCLPDCKCYSEHRWPVEFYRQTISGEIQIPDNEDCGDYGFGRSLEGGNHADGADEWNVDCLPTPGIDDAVLGEPPDPGCVLYEILWNLLLDGVVDYLNDPYATGEECVVDVNEDGSLDFQTCIVVAAQGGFTVELGWITVLVELEENANAAQFDVEFVSEHGAEGLLSVYWDGELLGSIDERFAAEGLATHTFGLPDEVQAGAHSLAFRLDGFTEVPSNAIVAIVSTGLVYAPPKPDIVGPDDFSAFRGFYDSGDLDSLLDSDDDKLCFEPGIVLNPTEAPVTLDFTGTLSNDSPSTLNVTIESSANTVGLELTFSFWNFNTNMWDVVGTDTQSLNDDTARTFAGNPADHVEPGTGEVRSRYEVRVVSFIFLFPWLDCVDHLFWTTTN